MVMRTQRLLTWLVVAVLIGLAGRAEATQKFGPLEISGNLQSQQLIRHPDIDQYQFIQQRNTMRVRVDYNWLKRGGKWFDRYDLSDWVDSSSLFLLYRGVYDSVYDYTPSFNDKFTFQGEKVDKRFDNLNDYSKGARNALKFENQLREAYVDIKFRGNFSLRAGKQQIIWGESDGFRLLGLHDRVRKDEVLLEEAQEKALGEREGAFRLLVAHDFLSGPLAGSG